MFHAACKPVIIQKAKTNKKWNTLIEAEEAEKKAKNNNKSFLQL